MNNRKLAIVLLCALSVSLTVVAVTSCSSKHVVADELDPNDCSREIDESNQETCDPFGDVANGDIDTEENETCSLNPDCQDLESYLESK